MRTVCVSCSKPTLPTWFFCPYCGSPIQHTAENTRRKRTRINGTGTAYKRGRSWYAQVTIGWKKDDAGRSIAIHKTKGGFPTKRDALDYCPTLLHNGAKPVGRTPLLLNYWDTYKAGEYAMLSTSKQKAYRYAWAKLKPLHTVPVDQITVQLLRDVVSQAAPTYYTARDCKTLLQHLFDLLGADGYGNRELPGYIILPKLEEGERKSFGTEEQRALWALYEAGDMRAAIPLLMICTGMMPGEAMQLKFENIDLEKLEICGVGMKTKVRKASPIIIPEDALPLVEDLIANAMPNGNIWPRTEKSWYAQYYEALEAAGCRRLEPYCCRHSTATRLAITENIAPQTIQRIMRWSTSRMLDRYTHPDTSDIHDAANTIRKGDTM